ncbi:response regulator [Paenibacillus filicis]|uniref:Response regulator n=1 Tax=Paenibacillus filicis TaxID=669464 RepID=A0ABU9DHY9_9BACL
MLRMILADDDELVRETLKEVVPWEKYGITIAGEADNGQTAYELCLDLQPEILFTDIKMPFMDGLEVAMRLKEAGSKTKIIIISGIQDFNYAKTAFDIHAEGYILKPIQITEIHEVITKVVSNIDMERNMHEKIQHLKQQLSENATLIREKFISNLLLGITTNKQKIRDKLDYFQIPIGAQDSLLAAVLQMDDYNRQMENKNEAEKQLISFSIYNIMNEIVHNYEAGLCHSLAENEFVILFNEKAHGDNKYIRICEEIIEALFKYLKISVSIGTGDRIGSIDQVESSYRSAVRAIQHRFYMGKRSVVKIEDITVMWNYSSSPGVDFTTVLQLENKLIHYVTLGDTDCGLQLLDELFSTFRQSDIASIQGFGIELVSALYRKVCEMGEDQQLEPILPQRNKVFIQMLQVENIHQMKEMMDSLFTGVSSYFSNKYNQKHLDLVHKIKALVQLNYTQDMSLSDIADEVFMSTNYICSVFKRETGMTINDYLTQVRMSEAKTLLLTTRKKVWEIAEGLGYENHNYFSTVFKKHTGMQPQQYRTKESSSGIN